MSVFEIPSESQEPSQAAVVLSALLSQGSGCSGAGRHVMEKRQSYSRLLPAQSLPAARRGGERRQGGHLPNMKTFPAYGCGGAAPPPHQPPVWNKRPRPTAVGWTRGRARRLWVCGPCLWVVRGRKAFSSHREA